MVQVVIHPTQENPQKSGVVSRSGAQTPGLKRSQTVGKVAVSTGRKTSASRNYFGLTTALGLAAVVLAVGGAGALYRGSQFSTHRSAATGADATGPVRAVRVARPTPSVAGSVVLPANLRPWQTATLNARASGYLAVWHQDLGARVKAGQLLAEIETPELDQELAQNEALANEAVAATAQAKAERNEAVAELNVAESQWARAKADLELVKSQLARREKLLLTHAISQEEYDTFQRQTEARAADVAAAKSEIAHRRTNLETRAAIIDVREATAKSRQSNVRRLKELLVFKKIVAPFDGVVTRRWAEVGALVTAGKDPLFTIEDMSRIRVQINVPQTYAMQTVPGAAALVTLPESTAPAVQGKITRVSNAVDSANRTMLAEIELLNESLGFQPGSYAQVTLTTPQNTAEWTIPTNTISMRVEGPHVAWVNDKNQIEVKRVSLGRNLGSRVAVVEGIRGDERLVVKPSDDLKEGLPVQVSQAQQPAEVAQR